VNQVLDAVAEANAAIGAAVSTTSLPAGLEDLLGEVQLELLDLADGSRVPPPDRLRRALRDLGPADVPRGFAVLGGFSAAAGLLKLATAITRRAARAAGGETAVYLGLLAELLLVVALRAEEHERDQIPLGGCFDVVGPTERSH
jgi:cob(I)alamin adenosyltransferase